jgi:hypothetical protein
VEATLNGAVDHAAEAQIRAAVRAMSALRHGAPGAVSPEHDTPAEPLHDHWIGAEVPGLQYRIPYVRDNVEIITLPCRRLWRAILHLVPSLELIP